MNTFSTFAPVYRDMSNANVRTNANTIREVASLPISVKYRRKTGISNIVTARQTPMSFATRAIFVPEKK